MDVTVDSGMSNVKIIVPKGVSARVLYDGGLSNVDLSGDWEKSGDDYLQEGTGPRHNHQCQSWRWQSRLE